MWQILNFTEHKLTCDACKCYTNHQYVNRQGVLLLEGLDNENGTFIILELMRAWINLLDWVIIMSLSTRFAKLMLDIVYCSVLMHHFNWASFLGGSFPQFVLSMNNNNRHGQNNRRRSSGSVSIVHRAPPQQQQHQVQQPPQPLQNNTGSVDSVAPTAQAIAASLSLEMEKL